MKKIVKYAGGQPVRPDDLELVQNQALVSAFEIINGLCGNVGECIVSGLEITTIGANNTVSGGFIWDGTELCYVPQFAFETTSGKVPYLVLNELTSDNRRFKDDSYHKVQINREYEGQYLSAQPVDSFELLSLSLLSSLLSISPDVNTFRLAESEVVSFAANFAHALGEPGTGIHVLKNTYNEIMIVAYFTATVTSGTIGTITLPIAITNPIIGYFWNGSQVGYLKIGSNGGITVSGAATGSAVNIIQFQVNLNVALPS